MSELINNREYRKEKIREVILALHQGKTVEEVKDKFDEVVQGIAPEELAAVEQELINEGLAVEEVQKLCDVHLAVFKSALDKSPKTELMPGHPIHTFKLENRAVEKLVAEIKELLKSKENEPVENFLLKLRERLNLLFDVEKHYSRKENLLFPFLERYEITGPSKIMWSHDDEIRDLLKQTKKLVSNYSPKLWDDLQKTLKLLLQKVLDMITKEEEVLFETALKVLTEDEWYQIMQESPEIGYCLIEPEIAWKPVNLNVSASVPGTETDKSRGYLKFETGVLKPEEIELILNHLPADITFVDKEGVVKYFSAGKDRIFVRARSIIGRKVENCHPPASVDIVEKLVSDLASGQKDQEDFWLHLGDKYVYIKYIAVRDKNGEFIGVVEFTQDINPLRAITGEKRIAD